jgi:parallel beta-helix repeat protein
MRMTHRERLAPAARAAALILALGTPALAVDGVIEINQTRALAGGVTPSDTPGFPVTINVAGSYRLTGNLSVNAGLPNISAIVVGSSSGVTIDLNGFALEGPSGCDANGCSNPGTSRGIDGAGSPSVTVRSGIVRGFPGGGILLGGRARVENVTAINNGSNAIQVDAGAVVTGCIAGSNAGNGITTGGNAIVEGNTADLNGQNGIQASQGCVLSRNTAASNAGTGIAASTNCTVQFNAARLNQGNGLSCIGCMLVGNTAVDNTQFGMSLDNSSGYAQSNLRSNNGGNANAQVFSGVDLGQNICGVPGSGNGIACP